MSYNITYVCRINTIDEFNIHIYNIHIYIYIYAHTRTHIRTHTHTHTHTRTHIHTHDSLLGGGDELVINYHFRILVK